MTQHLWSRAVHEAKADIEKSGLDPMIESEMFAAISAFPVPEIPSCDVDEQVVSFYRAHISRGLDALFGECRTAKLFDRLVRAKSILPKVQSEYRVVYEEPGNIDEPCKILVPDPNWMACALKGGILPPIGAYLKDQQTQRDFVKMNGSMEGFNWKDVGGAEHPYATPIASMSEEQAIEYLIQKDIPAHVWNNYRGNYPILKITTVNLIPADRTFRNAMRIHNEELAA